MKIASFRKKRGCIGFSRYTPSSTQYSFEDGARPAQTTFPLVPLKQMPRVHLVRNVSEIVTPAVGHDHVATGFESLQVVSHLEPEELLRVKSGLVGHHGNALGHHALHD